MQSEGGKSKCGVAVYQERPKRESACRSLTIAA